MQLSLKIFENKNIHNGRHYVPFKKRAGKAALRNWMPIFLHKIPIAEIVYKSYREGGLPQFWKHADVVLIPKKEPVRDVIMLTATFGPFRLVRLCRKSQRAEMFGYETSQKRFCIWMLKWTKRRPWIDYSCVWKYRYLVNLVDYRGSVAQW